MAYSEVILYKLLKSIIVEEKYNDFDLEMKPIASGCPNMTSHLYEVCITTTDRDKLNLFAKVAAAGEKLRTQTKVSIYATELLFYTTLARVYRQIEDHHGVPEVHRIGIPKSYGCNPTVHEETLVLENLTSIGFTTHDRLKSVEWEYAAAAVGKLAKLHALSIAYQHERPEEFEQLPEDLQLEWPKEGSAREVFLKAGFEVSLAVVKEENKDKFQKFFNSLNTETLKRYYSPLRRAVIAHGDYKPSNIMHRVDGKGRTQIVVVDYQLTRIGTPILDLHIFIVTGTDEQFRAQHYQRLLDHYHTQLSLALRRLHLDPDEMYSREDFDYDYKKKLLLGLVVAVSWLPITVADAENAPKASEAMELSSLSVHKTSKLFSDRINGIVNDFVKWGVLK